MNIELAIKQPKTELAPVGLNDPLAAYADAVSPQLHNRRVVAFFQRRLFRRLEGGDPIAGRTNFTVASMN